IAQLDKAGLIIDSLGNVAQHIGHLSTDNVIAGTHQQVQVFLDVRSVGRALEDFAEYSRFDGRAHGGLSVDEHLLHAPTCKLVDEIKFVLQTFRAHRGHKIAKVLLEYSVAQIVDFLAEKEKGLNHHHGEHYAR